MQSRSELFRLLKPDIVRLIGGAGGGGGAWSAGDHEHGEYLTQAAADALYLSEAELGTLQADVATLLARTVLAAAPLTSDHATFAERSPQIGLDVDALAGAGLGADDLALYVKARSGIDLAGDFLEVDEAYDFAWLGDHTHEGVSSSAIFSAADPILGARIDWESGAAWFSALEATTLNVKTFISDVTLALQGSQYQTKSKAILSRDFVTPAGSGTLYLHDLPGQPNTQVAESGDWVRLRYVTRTTGLLVADIWGRLTNYVDLPDGEQSWTFTRSGANPGPAGVTIYEGMVALDYGVSGDGYIEISSLGDDTPVITLRTWTTDPTAGSNHTTRASLGNLDGITDADLGVLSGWGLYSDAAHLRGVLEAGGGAVRLDDLGLSLATGDQEINALSWRPDPQDHESPWTAQLISAWYELAGRVRTWTALTSRRGAGTGTDDAYTDVSAGLARLALTDIGGAPEGLVDLQADDLSLGTLTLRGLLELYGDLLPGQSGVNLGSAGAPFDELHVHTLFAGTVSSTNTGHDHNDLYYGKSIIDSLLAGKAAVGHSHPGLVTTAALLAHTGDDDIHREINDGGTGPTVLWSAQRIMEALSGIGGDVSTAMWLEHTENDSIHALLDDQEISTATLWSSAKTSGAIAAAIEGLADADQLHDPVSVDGDVLTLVGQHVGLQPVVARTDRAQTWEAAQAFGVVSLDKIASDGLAIADANGDEHWFVDESGIIRSAGDDAFAANIRGVYLSPTGRFEAGDVKLRGEFISAVFSHESEVLNNGAMRWTPGGGATLAKDVSVAAPGGSMTIRIADPAYGQIVQFLDGHILRIRGRADLEHAGYTGRPIGFDTEIAPVIDRLPDHSIKFDADVWLRVTSHVLGDSYIDYICEVIQTADAGVTLRAGAGIANYKTPDDSGEYGYIAAIANDGFSPRLEIGFVGAEPWAGDEYPQLLLGRRDSSALVSSRKSGLLIAQDATDPDSGYVAIDPDEFVAKNLDLLLTDEDGYFLQITKREGFDLYIARTERSADEYWGGFSPPPSRRLRHICADDGGIMVDWYSYATRQFFDDGRSNYSDEMESAFRVDPDNRYRNANLRFSVGDEVMLRLQKRAIEIVAPQIYLRTSVRGSGVLISESGVSVVGNFLWADPTRGDESVPINGIYIDPADGALRMKTQ